MSAVPAPLEARFWPRVMVKEEGCWEWQGRPSSVGYGRFPVKVDGVWKSLYAHRFSYELNKGPIPEGLDLDHLCRNTMCVNPDHLEPVTRRENTLRGLAGRMVTHCRHGHEYTEENTGRSHGRRYCRTCKRSKMRSRVTCETCGAETNLTNMYRHLKEVHEAVA